MRPLLSLQFALGMAASVATVDSVPAATEIGFVEEFALAPDRATALKQLIPGTEDSYFYHALHLQNQGKRAEFAALLAQWAQRTPDSPMRRELETRQALLDYGADPRKTLDFIIATLGLRFDHQREQPAEKPNLPAALDPALISAAEFYRLSTNGVDHLQGLSERAIEGLVAGGHTLTVAQQRSALSKLTRPDVPNLVKFIAAELAGKESRGFGEFAIHRALTLAQLEELRKLRPDLGQNESFVLTTLGKLAPSADEDAEHDPAARQEWLDRAWAFVKGLGAPFHSLQAHLLYQRLDHDRHQGVYDPARFLDYVKLPRNAGYINPRWQENEKTWRLPADLNADFTAVTRRPAIGSDDALVRDYLLHLLAKADSPAAFAAYFEEGWLRAVFAEARLTAGVDDAALAEKLASALTPEAFEALKNRVDLDFDLANPPIIAPAETVSLDIAVKNVRSLMVKIYELNPAACYENALRPIGTDIDLDGLVPATQQSQILEAPPLHRIKRTFKLPEIGARRGVWVVEFIGNGRSSRALVRKGRLGFLTRSSSAGTALTVLDEAHVPVAGAYATFAGRRINPAENGEIVVPFTAQPGPQPVVLHDGKGFATLETITLAGESYALEAGFHVERETLLSGGKAKLAVSPRLRLNGDRISATLLENPRLVLTSTDLDGIATTATITPFKLANEREAVHEFKVPDRLAVLSVTLSGTVKSLSEAKPIELSTQWAFQVNEIDKAPVVSDLFLGRAADGYFLEERGKNGEPKPERAVSLTLQHRDYAAAVTVMVKTGPAGRTPLGALTGIAKLTAAAANGVTREWPLVPDAVNSASNIHALAGEAVRVPSFAKAAECSLVERRHDTYVKDWSANLADAEGFIEARNLPAGDYELRLRPEGRVVTLRLTQGQRVKNFLVSPNRLLEASPTRPLHVPSIAIEGDSLVIRVANADPLTRVHVAATRYQPAFRLPERLGGFAPPDLLVGVPGASLSQYVSGRQLGDELRYILDRALATHFPGVMLPRPGLLLNPWAVRDTATVKQDAQAGEAYARMKDARRAGMEKAEADAAAAKAIAPPSSQDPHSLDFLADQAPVSFNGVPDQDGVLRIPVAALGAASLVEVLALNAVSSVYRELALPAQPIKTRDLRLAAGLDPSQHFAQQDETVALEKDKPFTLDDAVSARFETYGDLGRVFTLFQTLTGNATLSEFAFILDWPTFDEKKKRELYSKFACHELSFFLERKDPAFFASTIQPYIANKKDRTFLDEYLTGRDLTPFLEPWRYGRLNTLERLLLAQRLPDQRTAETRALQDALALIPINREADRRLLETALRGMALDLADGEGKPGSGLNETREQLKQLRGLQRLNESLGNDAAKSGAAASAPESAGRPVGGAGGRAGGMGGGAKGARFSDTVDAGIVTDAPQPGAELFGAMGRFAKPAAEQTVADFDAGVALNYAFQADAKLRDRGGVQVFFRRLGVTQEWAENNYWKLLIAQQNAELVAPNRFWRDYAQRVDGRPFVSSHTAEAVRNFSEMMLALAVLDLPFPSDAKEPDARLDGVKLTLTPKTPLLLFHQAVRPAEIDEKGAKLLVSQNYYRLDDRYTEQDGEKIDKFVGEEFLAGVVYGAQVVVTNPTSSTQKLDVLFQIPRGSRPVQGAKITQNVPLRLEPFHTHTFDVAFYFPKAGDFPHFPVHVAREGKVVAFAPATPCKVVDQLSKPDTASWGYVSQNSTNDEVLAFLDKANLRTLDLDKIAWRMSGSADFFRAALTRLAARRVYHATSYSYGVKHNDAAAIREFLRHDGRILSQAGPWLASTLVTIDPVERTLYEHLEYSPLVNARAHRLGGVRTILNDRFREQYQRLLAVLAHKPALDDADRLAVTYYLLLQDRSEEALSFFAGVKKAAITTALQYDYAAAWLSLVQADTKAARTIAAAHTTEPVDKWRERFEQLIAQIDEIEGKGPAITTPDDREQTQDMLAAQQPNVELKVEDQQVKLDSRNLAEVTLNYYLMDLELLFSTNPFVGQDSGRFSQIVPNKSERVPLDAPAGGATASKAVPLPREFQNKNVLVEVVAAGQRKAQAVYANELKITLSESFGQVQVRHARDDRPLGKVYVKVYAEVNGHPTFYKDGYTDLRGKFDYASLSTDDLGNVTRFALLVLSDEHGAVVKEAKPPRQ